MKMIRSRRAGPLMTVHMQKASAHTRVVVVQLCSHTEHVPVQCRHTCMYI